MNRRIKALETLRLVEENQLDLLAQDLVKLRTAQDDALARERALGQRAIEEAATSAPESLRYIGRFLANLRKEQIRERQVAEALNGQIEELRSAVEHHFKSERTYDHLAETARALIVSERLRKSEAALEDMIASRFARA